MKIFTITCLTALLTTLGCANNKIPNESWLVNCVKNKKSNFFNQWNTSDEDHKAECLKDWEGLVQLKKDGNPLVAVYNNSFDYEGVEYSSILEIASTLRARGLKSVEFIWPRNYVDSNVLSGTTNELNKFGITNIYIREVNYLPGIKIPLEYFNCTQSPASKDICREASLLAEVLEDDLPKMVNSSTIWTSIQSVGSLIELNFELTYGKVTLESLYNNAGLDIEDAKKILLSHKTLLCSAGTPTREFIDQGGHLKYIVTFKDGEHFTDFEVDEC